MRKKPKDDRAKPRHAPLTCRVTRNGMLRIEIGVETLANAAVFFAKYKQGGAPEDPPREYEVTNARGFALDIESALESETEVGESILTGALDTAIEMALNDGSLHFREKPDCPYPDKHANDCTCRGTMGDR